MGSVETLRSNVNKDVQNRTKFIGWPKSIDIKGTWYSPDGFQINAKPKEQSTTRRKVGGRTARHEAKHALPNPDNVKSVTIIPGPGYRGLTELYIPDPVAALAPHATGEDGTGQDVMVASFITNNVSAAENAARGIVNNNTEEIEEIASVLEEKKTITGNEVKKAIHNVRNRKEEVQLATVFIKSPDGSETIHNLDVRNGIVTLPPRERVVPSKYYELPKEGIIFSNN